jgi:hypothetical protein
VAKQTTSNLSPNLKKEEEKEEGKQRNSREDPFLSTHPVWGSEDTQKCGFFVSLPELHSV